MFPSYSGLTDIALGQATSGSPVLREYMLTGPGTMIDITPASTRRSDGDARYALIETESYWSQNEWGAGYGTIYPADPTAYANGPCDTLTPNRLRPALQATGTGAGVGSFMQVKSAPYVWHVQVNTGTYTLYYQNTAGVFAGGFALPAAPTCLTAYRGYIVVSYGAGLAANAPEYYTTAGKATTGWPVAVGAITKSQLTCPYSSMLFYMRYDATGNQWTLNRTDPENSSTVIGDLARFPIANTVDNPRSMVAIGGDLYILFSTSLWKFTSANGNVGILTGPLDTWAPSGGQTANQWSGVGISFQGALIYSVGGYVRRYQPGGQARSIWPLPQHKTLPGQPYVLDFCAFEVANDRLYIAATISQSAFLSGVYLLCWDGLGMHMLGATQISTTGSSGFAGIYLHSRPGLAQLMLLCAMNGTITAGNAQVYYWVGDDATRLYATSSVWQSSQLDFGMVDIDKTTRLFGVAATVPAGCGIAMSIRLESGVTYPLEYDSGTFPTSGSPRIVYYRVPTTGTGPGAFNFKVLTGKVYEIFVTMTTSGAQGVFPEVYAINCIPNPVNPVRRGFHFTIDLAPNVVNYDGVAPYATGGVNAVIAELTALRTMRASGTPVCLAWTDNNTYYCRINSLQITRVMNHLKTEFVYEVTLDMQELS